MENYTKFFTIGDVANNIEIFLKDYKSSDITYLNLKKVLNGSFEIVDWKNKIIHLLML